MNTQYEAGIAVIRSKHGLPIEIQRAYQCVLDFVVQEKFEGACHATSGILHVLLSEMGIESRLVCGEVGLDDICFDHSWIEIDGGIYDISVALPLVAQFASNPIFFNYDIVSLGQPKWNYDFKSGLSDDSGRQVVRQLTFTEYMNAAPYHKNGLWYFVQKIGGRIGLKPSLNKMREKHRNTTWNQK